jgi:hypothetical protein
VLLTLFPSSSLVTTILFSFKSNILGVGQGGEMTQALYAHMNNKRKKSNILNFYIWREHVVVVILWLISLNIMASITISFTIDDRILVFFFG